MTRRKSEAPPTRNDSGDIWMHESVKDQINRRAIERLDEKDNFDAYVNAITGIGDWNRDKTFGGQRGGLSFEVNIIPAIAAEGRWRGSDLGGRVVEAVPDEMTREGWELTVQPNAKGEDETEQETSETEVADFFPGQEGQAQIPVAAKPKVGILPDFDGEGTDIVEGLDGVLEELGASDALWWALCFERAYGGGAILMGADDGQEDLSKPLDEERISSVRWLNAFQGGYDGEVVAWSYYRDIRSPKYGLPETYMIRNLGVPITSAPTTSTPVKQKPLEPVIFWVHESRLLVFPGTPVSRQARVQMRGWGDSIFTRIDKVLSDYNQTWGGVANLMTDFSQGVLNIEGLKKALAGGDKAARGNPVTTRARQIQLTRSIARMLFLDKEEEFSRHTVPLSGVADVLQQFSLRLAAAADMPVTLLMGQAPSGLNATGASDVRFFYDRIAARQRKRMLPQLKRLIKLILLSKEGPTEGVQPERWNAKFKSLYQMTALEQADLRNKQANTDHLYIQDGAVSPEEVAASRFGGSEYSTETVIDFEGRAEMAKQAEADKTEKQKVMSESAKLGVSPGQLALEHPEHPSNAPPDPNKMPFPPKKE